MKLTDWISLTVLVGVAGLLYVADDVERRERKRVLTDALRAMGADPVEGQVLFPQGKASA